MTIKHCLKTGENSIPDGSFSTSAGQINYYAAKNITYVDSFGDKDYFIVWKTTPDKYSWVNTQDKVNQYVSCYLTGDIKGKCFVVIRYLLFSTFHGFQWLSCKKLWMLQA